MNRRQLLAKHLSVTQWALSSSATHKIHDLHRVIISKIESLWNITICFFESKLNSTQKTHNIHEVWTSRLAQNQPKWYRYTWTGISVESIRAFARSVLFTCSITTACVRRITLNYNQMKWEAGILSNSLKFGSYLPTCPFREVLKIHLNFEACFSLLLEYLINIQLEWVKTKSLVNVDLVYINFTKMNF